MKCGRRRLNEWISEVEGKRRGTVKRLRLNEMISEVEGKRRRKMKRTGG